jgi:hypothetical protein
VFSCVPPQSFIRERAYVHVGPFIVEGGFHNDVKGKGGEREGRKKVVREGREGRREG